MCIQWNDFLKSVTLFLCICVFNGNSVYLMIIFIYYCVFNGIHFSNSIFPVTPATMILFFFTVIFLYFIILTNVCVLIYLGGITTILIKLIVFTVSIAIFQFSSLHVLRSWSKFQKDCSLTP